MDSMKFRTKIILQYMVKVRLCSKI